MKRWIMLAILAGASLFLFLLFNNTSAQLYSVKAELNSTQTQLDLTKTELDSTQTQLESTKAKLASTETELRSAEMELAATEMELQSLTDRLKSVETELAAALDSLDTVQAKLEEKEAELAELQINYDGLMAGHGYTIKDPSYRDLMRFLAEDDTDKLTYIEGEYECTEFATTLCNRAEDEGIRSGYVTISFPDGKGHAIVAFNTIDKGLIYIEPQHDDLVEIVIGKPFHECIVPKPGYYYIKPPYDDTIEKVLVAW